MVMLLRWMSVLESESPDAILLTIDGENPKSADSMSGTIAHRFAEVWPGAWEQAAQALEEHLAAHGTVTHGHALPVILEPSECPFRVIVFASTLRHVGDLAGFAGLAASGLAASLEVVAGLDLDAPVQLLQVALMKGGWRLSARDAFDAMVAGYRRYVAHAGPPEQRERSLVDLHVHVAEADRGAVEAVARARGFLL